MASGLSKKSHLRAGMALAAAFVGVVATQQVAEAAWPDGYPGRVKAMDAIRYDVAYPGIVYDAAQVKARYEDACKNKSSSACNWTKWQGAQGGELAKIKSFYAGKCPQDPLACVALGYVENRDEKGNIILGEGGKPAKANEYFETACEKKAYAPACSSLGEAYLYGSGVAVDYARALKLVDEGCKAEDPWGCYLQGTLLESGKGGSVDNGRAVELYTTACNAKIPHACVALGTMIEDGRAGSRDLNKAAKTYGDACDGNYMGGCYQVGRMYDEGKTGTRNTTIASQMFKKSCDGGDILGCFGLATYYENGTVPDGDVEDAVKIYDEACQRGHTKACSKLGELYIRGKGVNKDVPMGVGFIQKACDANDLAGCGILGQLYESGNGVEMNIAKASELYKNACDRGDGKSCGQLANFYEVGKGVDQNAGRALELYEKACTSGHGKSCGKLANRYMTGDGVDKNMAKASELLDKGCTGGDGASCAKLGGLYNSGKGVKADPARAIALFESACDYDNGQGCFDFAEAYAKGTNGMPVDFKKAGKGYSRGCELKFEKACSAGGSIVFQSRMEEVLSTAFESTMCQVWSQDREDPEKTKQVVLVNKKSFEVMDGPLKGNTVNLAQDPTEYKTVGKKQQGLSKWRFNNGKKEVTFKHIEEWDSENEPIDSFPGDSSYSEDRVGGIRLVYSREEQVVKRAAPNPKCAFPGYLVLTTEHCSEVQALIAAQLISECKGE